MYKKDIPFLKFCTLPKFSKRGCPSYVPMIEYFSVGRWACRSAGKPKLHKQLLTVGTEKRQMANFARYQNLPFDFSALRVSICECLKGLVHEKPLCGTKCSK